MATVQDVLLPDIGDFSGVEIIEILVAPGDRIEPEQSLLTLESDKATMEIPAPQGGVVKELKIKVGDKIGEGDLLLTLEADVESADEAASPTMASMPEPAPPVEEPERPPAQARRGGGEVVDVRLPDIGDFTGIPVIEVLVGAGERITVDQSLVTLESDKATMEIPSPNAGEVQAVAVKVGDRLNQGDMLVTLIAEGEAAGTDAGPPEPAAEETESAQAPAATPKPGTAARMPGEKEPRHAPVLPRPADLAAIAKGRKPHASPAVRRFARELGVDLSRVKGSGPKERILKGDVQDFVKQALGGGAVPAPAGLPFQLPPAPEADFAKFGEVETVPVPRIKKISGAHLHRCWLTVPHVTQFDEADITELEAFRKGQKEAAAAEGVKLTFLPFLLKAVASALNDTPNLKASLAPDGESLTLKKYTHIGVAVDTPNGLMVPVVRDVDQKGVLDLARELAELSAKAREGKLLPGDMRGGCFSISSLGGIGGTAFTPIVNLPEVAILGVSRSEMKPKWNGSEFVPKLMLPLSLSYDHRVVDGAEGVRFTSLLGQLLGDIRRLLL
ncbi:MAG: dihydrolipoyllysine-residue acetyltransferase [Pseudomonadota bacterium]|nr:dihydrolipoyllysine-residue acetyltransferase [Pseudomonadota bacterium]